MGEKERRRDKKIEINRCCIVIYNITYQFLHVFVLIKISACVHPSLCFPQPFQFLSLLMPYFINCFYHSICISFSIHRSFPISFNFFLNTFLTANLNHRYIHLYHISISIYYSSLNYEHKFISIYIIKTNQLYSSIYSLSLSLSG